MYSGTDESGRGPIIGPMVMVTIGVKSDDEIPKTVRDSKTLTRAAREALFERLLTLQHSIKIISPKEIDAWVFQKKLNYLEAEKTAEMLNELKPTKAIIDCPARNMDVYKAYIAERAPGIDLHVQYKADAEHPVVSAASIIAKVTRDRLIEQIKTEAGIDFGSGYLTDPKTQAFMATFDPDFPHYRKSWKPYQERLAASQQQTLF